MEQMSLQNLRFWSTGAMTKSGCAERSGWWIVLPSEEGLVMKALHFSDGFMHISRFLD